MHTYTCFLYIDFLTKQFNILQNSKVIEGFGRGLKLIIGETVDSLKGRDLLLSVRIKRTQNSPRGRNV
jgi:hypothetical protein